jgi:hypothetical protein
MTARDNQKGLHQGIDTSHVFGDVIAPDRESGDGKRGRHNPWLTSGTINGAPTIWTPSKPHTTPRCGLYGKEIHGAIVNAQLLQTAKQAAPTVATIVEGTEGTDNFDTERSQEEVTE